ncbi:general substrate transporter [Aaosphaeria arxii CBS 175.79]|uniref:General substrate transporter n=1 Tax=Aaosphaeria arxii CBS 175.79 TaxID=1450172 RepID=A0A6A5X6K1_9PLEO|nr:general substrate transporter [Aaosphaeria arxii CBS 175.79]KAF2008540.1 general substrate transporter [Aaosphaeria arxii CBS 175.79]
MKFFKKRTDEDVPEKATSSNTTPAHTPLKNNSLADVSPPVQGRVPAISVILGAVASVGGFMFGYESGQISGFLAMPDFIERFGDNGEFSAVRQGTIVGLLAIGTMIGCLSSAPLADTFGRRLTISGSAFFYIIGVIIEITSKTVWAQFAMGRFTAGLGIGALSTVVPMYQSESIPKRIRGATVSSYQLFITLGIWTAYMINYGTRKDYSNSAQWRIPNGLSALWAILLGSAILLLPESPRFAYRKGRIEEARRNMARLNGVPESSPLIDAEIKEIQDKLEAENAGGEHPWYEIFTGPRMLYRTLLGMVLQAGQQLTGANYFFYYGTTIFSATGLENSYVTSIILGTVNVAATIVGLWIVENVGRRKAMMAGAAWMFMCLFIYSFVGQYQLNHSNPQATPQAGNIMIVFTCLFIAAFATTWGPLVWAIVGELYPARYRATCMALATASNWLFNFLISFFSTMITDNIDYFYGLVFGGCCFVLFFVVYFFMIETKGRSLEEIDTMYILHVNPITSAKWQADSLQQDGLVNTDRLHVGPGGRSWSKAEQGGADESRNMEHMTV